MTIFYDIMVIYYDQVLMWESCPLGELLQKGNPDLCNCRNRVS